MMNLFRKSQTEVPAPAPELAPAPEPASDAATEERDAAANVATTSALCTALDAEQKSWSARRNAAYRDFCVALGRHAAAKVRLSKQAA